MKGCLAGRLEKPILSPGKGDVDGRHFAKVSPSWPRWTALEVSHFSLFSSQRIAKAHELKELGNKLFRDDVKGALRQYHFAMLNIREKRFSAFLSLTPAL